jgi:hypothetical protein
MKKHFAFLLSLLVLFTIGSASFDYLGPDRTRTSYVLQRKHCFYTADMNYGGTHYGCHLNLYTTPDGTCPSAGSTTGYFSASECSWPVSCGAVGCSPVGPSVSIEDCSGGEQGCRSVQVTTTYPEAGVSAGIVCSNPGANGWCTGSASLEIASSEPVPGFNILTVEGTRNGSSFACSGSACSVPLLEGTNEFTFWALSSWGDSSGMGTATGYVDTQPPFVDGTLSGIAGGGGWFVSPVEVSAAASDATSGVGSLVYSFDGGGQAAYTGPLTLGDGMHSIVFTATDVAGNSSSTTVNVNVDSTAPSLAVDPASGTAGENGWFVSQAALGASAADGGSGLASLEYSIDGGPVAPYSGPLTLGDGAHTVVFTATDQAGNSVSASAAVNVDTQAPSLSLNGITSYYPARGTMDIDYSVGDSGSGIMDWVLSVDGTALAAGTAAETGTLVWDGGGLPAGAHTITLQGRDLAGNVTQTEFLVTLIIASAHVEPTPTTIPVRRATATPTAQPSATSTSIRGSSANANNPTAIAPSATRTNAVVAFAAPPREEQSQDAPSASPAAVPAAGVMFGAEAAAAIGAAMAAIAAENQRRKEEEAKAAAESARFNASQIAIEEQRRQSAAQRAYEKKVQEELRQTFEAKIQEARAWGLNSYAEAGFREMAANQGYGAAIAALDNYIISGIQIEAARKEEEERRKKEEEERKRQEAEAWLAANAEKSRQAMEAEKERQRQVAAEAAAAAAAQQDNRSWWEKLAGKAAGIIEQTAADLVSGLNYAAKFIPIKTTDLGSGKVSLSINVPAGDKQWFKTCLAEEGFDLTGTRYNATTVALRTGAGLLKNSVQNASVATAGLGSFAGNLFEYGYGHDLLSEEFIDNTVENQDFWAATIADTIIAVGVGVAAAAAVSAGIAFFALAGVTAPVWVAVAATTGLAVLGGLALEASGVNDWGKGVVNQAIDNIKSWWPF